MKLLKNVAYDTQQDKIIVVDDDCVCLPWMYCSDSQLLAAIPQEIIAATKLYYDICLLLSRLESGDKDCICKFCNQTGQGVVL